jgi:hypothetical protein
VSNANQAVELLRQRAEKLAQRPAVQEYLSIKLALEQLEAEVPPVQPTRPSA